MEKTATKLINIFSDGSMTDQEWSIVGFHFQNMARVGVMRNLLTFYDGMQYHYSHRQIEGQQEIDLGGFDGIY